ncbi:non-ribosomal peptide synthetase [Mycobacterium kyorinense]|uniref:Non-ribosomal peptide synthetase n=1 Tax=Mycobacterium kyorinense TaxID=487514 RepID=A0A1X1YEV7_9MYCO|nr:non-ribosomal peptide synthetase [Mycobacterium kyorinense]ORW09560.1 non-ribosomal peptide synthetase [Mycobacterium kyorinense]
MTDNSQTVQDRRRELLRKRIAQSGATAGHRGESAVIRPGERYQLSAGQRRMWFLQTMDPSDSTLNICVAYRLTGPLDEGRLRAAVSEVVARHALLRTTYRVDGEGEPYQEFHDDIQIPWRTHDLTALPDVDRQLEALASGEFGRPFDLANELPLRVSVVRTGADESVLLLVVHHICWDDDCWDLFFGELSAAYNGQPPAGQAPQYVAVEVLAPSAEPTEADVAYWRNSLQPLPEPVELPGPAAANPSRRAERRTRAVPADLFGRVEAFAREHATSPFTVLLAAFGVLIRRYTGAADFVVAVPVTDRRAAAQNAIGYFGNTLLLRLAAGPHDSFASFVDTVRETCLGGFAHQCVGIDRVVNEAHPERTPGRDGMEQLVRLGFSMRKSVRGFSLDGIVIRQLELGAVSAPVPVAMAIVLEREDVLAEIEYQVDLLRGELVDQMLTHYLQLLDNALSEPGHRVTGLDMLGPGERAAVAAQSHGELVATPPSTLVAMLESVAAATPDAVALVSDDAELTYAELHRRANRLARWLIGKGIGTEDVIGLRLATSIEFIVAVLGVHKAGAAYLPIDPSYPQDRIDYLITDTRPRMVIGRQQLDAAETVAAHLPDATVTDAERVRPLHPDNLAYVIYTSGSTGRPKGVAVSHRAIAEHVDGFIAEWSMTADDRMLQSSSVSFDASLPDIFMTLSIGARLVVPKPEAFGDIDYIADLIDRHGITVVHMVPSLLGTLLALPEVKQWRALRHVPVGGEALPGQVADKFATYFDAELRNHYGPTEAVVCSTHKLVERSYGTGVVPIGVPNRNVYTYVLDQELQPVPAEVVGELYLGGAQLARGYLGRPGLTAERFVADPFNPGMRLYRTGDLVRRNMAGELEFVGRADEQVKVRGFRIEPGEVESAITSHPAVQQCLVLATDTEAGPMLAAYVVPRAQLNLDELRDHAATLLPDYMLPNAFALIPEIPLTVSGKLDKRALPAPTPIAARAYREPATTTERRICSIFARLFGCERVGADDSFFELGGHSLLAARLVAQVRAEFGVELAVRAVFDTPTPAGLATRLVDQFRAEFDIDLDDLDVGETFGDAEGTTRPELVAAARPERIPLSYSQLAAWFQYRMDGARDAFNLPLALRFSGPLDTTALAEALNDVVARHEALRTNFGEHEGIPYQFVQPRLGLELPVRQVGAAQVDETIASSRRDVLTPEAGPLIRATLLAVDPDTHVLLVIVHHIVGDHASLEIIYDDLVAAYRARLAGQPPQWSTLPIQFVDYALWQRNAFDEPSAWGGSEVDYWREALAGLPDETSIVPDHERQPVLGKRGEVVTFTISAAQRAALARLAEQNGATEFMVYQAAVAVLVHKLGGGTDIALGSPVASRVEPATTNLVGLFANIVVLRNDLSGNPSLRAIVGRSRDMVLDAFAHQEVPVERLVEAVKPARSRFRNPLYQTTIHFRGKDWVATQRDLTATGQTTVVALPMDFDVSLLDLDVSMHVTSHGELDVRVVANADLYEPQTVRLIADALKAALDAFATTPDCPVSTVELLAPADLAKVLAPPTPATAGQSQAGGRGSAETERQLIAMLEELLDITGVDRDDNFFALGGDSIISIKWSAQAGAQGLALTPAMVFEHMTIGELAAAVDAAAPQGNSTSGQQYTPMSASGLSADALAELTAAWQEQS